MKGKVRHLKWRNKWSGEEGFVMKVSAKSKCFYNTYEKESAKKYTSDSAIDRDIRLLNEVGEAENNEFFVVD